MSNESHASVPTPLFMRLCACYFGDGPRYGEKPPQPPTTPVDDVEGDSNNNLSVDDLMGDAIRVGMPKGVTPMGTAKRYHPDADEADDE